MIDWDDMGDRRGNLARAEILASEAAAAMTRGDRPRALRLRAQMCEAVTAALGPAVRQICTVGLGSGVITCRTDVQDC